MKIKYLVWILILIPTAFAFSECSDTNEIEYTEIPCNSISDYIIGCPEHYNYTVYSIDNSYYVQNGTMTILNDNIYNFTLWNVSVGSYNIWLCDNSTSSITIIQGDNTRYLYIFALLIILILYLIGIWKNDHIFVILAGFSTCIFAIYSYVNGLIDLNNTMVEQGVLMLLLGIGFYFIGISAYKLSKEGW